MGRNVLILGKRGQLGRHLVKLFPGAMAWGREQLDLCDNSAIHSTIRAANPTWVINASAYTAVDKAESEESLALQINGHAVGEIAKVCTEIGAKLVQYSTDYVFDGSKEGAYLESDATNPINAYGRTKLAGEQQVAANCDQHWIFRTSWVFSEYAPNFVKTMARLGRERSELEIVDDQYGKPTYAGELARVTRCLVQEEISLAKGIHHFGCPDATNWFDFAAEIFEQAEAVIPQYAAPILTPVGSADYMTPAARPQNSILYTSSELGVRPWREFVSRCLV